jgi:ATP phosphoribosyltransferase
MPDPNFQDIIHLAVPKGRIEAGVSDLLADAGLGLRSGPRGYRPVTSVEGFEVKLLKPQNIVEMLAAGSRDIGFAGEVGRAHRAARHRARPGAGRRCRP